MLVTIFDIDWTVRPTPAPEEITLEVPAAKLHGRTRGGRRELLRDLMRERYGDAYDFRIAWMAQDAADTEILRIMDSRDWKHLELTAYAHA